MKKSFLLMLCFIVIHNTFSQDLATKDFLNNYFFNQIPLNNNNFSLKLTKVIVGTVEIDNNEVDDDRRPIWRLPELLDVSELELFKVRPNIRFSEVSKQQELMISVDINELDSFLPKIEILKNKLFTIKNKDKEENFLLNVKKGGLLNFRKSIALELASEDVTSDGLPNKERDMIWNIVAIGNECYIALTGKQMNRIGVQIIDFSEGVLIRNQNSDEVLTKSALGNSHYGKENITTGNGLYLGRKKDKYMDDANFLAPHDLIFLFKLN